MACENTDSTSPEVGEVNGDNVYETGSNGANYNVVTHGYDGVWGDASYNQIDDDYGHNRCHMQSWWDDSLTIDTCGWDVNVGASHVTYRVESSYYWSFSKKEPDEPDLTDGTGYDFSAFVSAGFLLNAGVQLGVSVPGDNGDYVTHNDYSHIEWGIDLTGEVWPDCQDPSPGVKFDLNTDEGKDSSYNMPCKSTFEYRWNCGTGWFYEQTPEVSYDAQFNVVG